MMERFPPSKKLVVYGAGGHGREMAALARATVCRDGAEMIGYVDDGPMAADVVGRDPVLGGFEWLASQTETIGVVMGIGWPVPKADLVRRLDELPHVVFPTLIHPTSIVEVGSHVGRGVTIAAFCHVSVDTCIEDFVLLNGYVSVGHDAIVGELSSVMPHASISGGVRIGRECMVGTGAAIMQGVSVGDGASIGMGSSVTRDVESGAVVMGPSARRVR